MQFFEDEKIYKEWALIQSDENAIQIYAYI